MSLSKPAALNSFYPNKRYVNLEMLKKVGIVTAYATAGIILFQYYLFNRETAKDIYEIADAYYLTIWNYFIEPSALHVFTYVNLLLMGVMFNSTYPFK